MDNQNFKRIIKRILKILLAIIIFVIISFTSGKTRNKTAIEEIIGAIINVPQKLITYLKVIASDEDNLLFDIDKLKSENNELKEKIKDLEKKYVDYDLIIEENNAFKALEQTQYVYNEYNVVIADVIAITQNNWDDVYIINKGSNSNIKKDMTVITSDGLVGYIEEVGKDTSKVVSILDASSSFSGVENKSRERVIIKGDLLLKDEGKLKAVDIPLKTKFESGDLIETSGIGGLYPKGIKIGRITEFVEKRNPLENEAIIETSVDFDKLERVAVIIK